MALSDRDYYKEKIKEIDDEKETDFGYFGGRKIKRREILFFIIVVIVLLSLILGGF